MEALHSDSFVMVIYPSSISYGIYNMYELLTSSQMKNSD
jgi:hypothetical protein